MNGSEILLMNQPRKVYRSRGVSITLAKEGSIAPLLRSEPAIRVPLAFAKVAIKNWEQAFRNTQCHNLCQ